MYEEKPGRGWDRKIKYDVKEYMQYLTATKEIAGRLGVSVEDVEKVGFVLGREAVSKDAAPAPDKKGSSAKVKEEAPPPSKRPRSSEAGEEAEEAVKTRKRVKANEAEKERMPKPASSGRTLRSRSLMNPNE